MCIGHDHGHGLGLGTTTGAASGPTIDLTDLAKRTAGRPVVRGRPNRRERRALARRNRSADRRRAAQRRHPSGRTSRAVVLVDIENLLGDDPRAATSEGIRATLEELVERARIGTGDLVYVTCNPALAPLVAEHIGGWHLEVRGGRDGADLALLDQVADHAWLLRSADRLVVASGDGAFTDLVQRCNHDGLPTVVVANARDTAQSLRRNAGRFLPLGRPAQFALAA
jgi:hypothetical protein